MTHKAGHIAVNLTTPINSDKPAFQVWHAALGLFVLGFVVGALVF